MYRVLGNVPCIKKCTVYKEKFRVLGKVQCIRKEKYSVLVVLGKYSVLGKVSCIRKSTVY